MMTPEEAEALADRMHRHVMQIDAGLIPEDSPPGFLREDWPTDGTVPPWFGPDYNPTPEAIESFLFSDPTKPPSAD